MFTMAIGRLLRIAGSSRSEVAMFSRIVSVRRWLLIAALLTVSPSQARAQAELTEEEVLARFAHEPTVQQVQDAAIRYYQVHPDRIRSLRRNAQLKALVPTISGKFSNSLYSTNRKMDDGLYISGLQGIPKEDERQTGDSLGFSVGLDWSLDRLVFNAEVLDVQSLIGILDGVVREVTTVYYIRRRLQIDMVLRPPRDLPAKISQRIRIEELTGLLDALTGNYMSRALAKAEKRAAKSGKVPAPLPAPVPASADDGEDSSEE